MTTSSTDAQRDLLIAGVGVQSRQLVFVGNFADERLDDFQRRMLFHLPAESLDHRPKLLDRLHGRRRKIAQPSRKRQQFPHRLAALDRFGQQPLDGRLADPSGGHVDDPQQRHLVGRVHQQFQVGQDVADFLAVVERHPAQQHVRNLRLAQLHFKSPGLLVRPAENGKVLGTPLLLGDPRRDLGDDPLCFLDLILQLLDPRRLAATGGPQHLDVPELVEGDQPVGPIEDFAGGAVVDLQAHDLGLGPVVLEAEDVGHLGAPPAVDRLVVVAHHAQVAMPGRQTL